MFILSFYSTSDIPVLLFSAMYAIVYEISDEKVSLA